ncbi:MAG: ZIP family metal transporter [Candidatus Woesearchaeota archaeon]
MSATVWMYSLGSVVLVSLVSLVGVVTLGLKEKLLRKVLLFLVSFSAGSLFGGAFFHLIPEAVEGTPIMYVSAYVMLGILFFFILEKGIHWRHCHIPTSKDHPHHLGMMNLVGDVFHNLIDGLVIGGAYLVSIPLGTSTTIAILFHEVPQEIGDFGVLLHAGYTKAKALMYNFLSALSALIGVIIALTIGMRFGWFAEFLVPFTAGGFLYIAGSDLIPEMHKECSAPISLLQLSSLILGLLLMVGLNFFG